jgi:hypothetical protein
MYGVEYTLPSTELVVDFLVYAIHLRQVLEKMGFSALTRAKTEENNGFRTPLPYVFAARRTVGQFPCTRKPLSLQAELSLASPSSRLCPLSFLGTLRPSVSALQNDLSDSRIW